ncbi:DEAD/DEAH box helicase family protein [uncultured Erythrobacter sp.]|uniref:DEAD/DEAH box helicase family protein n=1 Tax=uncultured Erythrobacter sp. TaxID=263913 RepID=UPI002629D817|nr:DEAD/DEAH box helicase family protein [uncultured Erythrobacter sp.]
MQFAGEWREYQARVLAEMESHLGDDRLHVVAAPGAGKTVLGLEIVRQLGKPALVFAPSLAIRDQWGERLVPLFMAEMPPENDISRNLADPRALTLSTYQSLDSFRRSDDLTDLIATLNEKGPLTLVLDEAHHLRRAWWECLDRLAKELNDVTIVALTATPPYDASFAEWKRYEALCGPIDLEIGIPELVRNGDLCPHQDHLVLSRPTEDALAVLARRHKAIGDLQLELINDDELLEWLARHPWLTDPDAHIEDILEAPEMLSAALILLGSAGRKLPREPLDLLGVSASDLPRPSLFWLERLLDGLLFRHKQVFVLDQERRETLHNRLQRHGLIEGGKVRLQHTRSVFRLLASSLAKLDSIAEIAETEHGKLGDELRMVVLSDHIRAGELPRSPEAEFKPAKLGVIPIFESLRRAGIAEAKIGVLTGSLVIIPRSAMEALGEVAERLGMPRGSVRCKDIKACPGHVELQPVGGNSADQIRLVTALFLSGEVRILVGTQSLLGQGWDAPALNSLVLASNTASFMLSNQMRGRAIRIDPHQPDKVANIWHLATIEPDESTLAQAVTASLNWGAFNDGGSGGVSDIGVVARRFRAFECISNGEARLIESGLGRLDIDPAQSIATLNRQAFAIAADRAGIASKWSTSLGDGEARSRVRETAAPNYAPRRLSWFDTLHSAAWSAGSTAALVAGNELRAVASFEGLGMVAMGAAGIATLASLPRLAKAARLAWRNGSLEGSLGEVAQAILRGLAEAKIIAASEVDAARIDIRTSVDGRKDVIVAGVSRAAERAVMQAIAEVLGPVQNPRYLLVRKSWLGPKRRTDYHAVPAALGARKEYAEAFLTIWKSQIGSSKLVFTRNREGRQVLLRARMKSLAAGFQRSVDRRSAWL